MKTLRWSLLGMVLFCISACQTGSTPKQGHEIVSSYSRDRQEQLILKGNTLTLYNDGTWMEKQPGLGTMTEDTYTTGSYKQEGRQISLQHGWLGMKGIYNLRADRSLASTTSSNDIWYPH